MRPERSAGARAPADLPAPAAPRVIDLLAGVRPGERATPYGSVWEVVSAGGLEAALVVKQGEQIDPGWFSPDAIDLIVLLRGRLRVELDRGGRPLDLRPGDLLVIEPGMRCRAYRWPRSSPRAAVFLAVYPRTAARPSVGAGVADAERNLPARGHVR